MLWFLVSAALAYDSEICKVERPVSAEELHAIFDNCIVPVGTRITIYVEEVDAQPPVPGIGFKPNDISLNQNGKDTLDGVAAILTARKKLNVKVVGYVDPGEQGDLLDLSLRRAQVAAEYISSKGIDPARILVEAGGADSRIDYSDTQEGRARNRRVEFVISSTELAK